MYSTDGDFGERLAVARQQSEHKTSQKNLQQRNTEAHTREWKPRIDVKRKTQHRHNVQKQYLYPKIANN